MDVSNKTSSAEKYLNAGDIKNNWVKPEAFKLDSPTILGFPGTGSDIGSVPNETIFS